MIRIFNTRTGRRTRARNGKDAAEMVKIEQDRRSFIEINKAIVQTPAQREADMHEANRVHRQAVAS